MKKLIIFIITIILIFIIFIYILLSPKDYSINYQINGYEITEKYNKKEEKYYFNISSQNINYPLLINTKYNKKRKKITKIIEKKIDKEKCLNIKVEKETYYICSNKNNIKTLNTMSSKFLKDNYNIEINNQKQSEYKKISIYKNNKKIYIWNYKGFYLINENNNKTIDLFKKDNYKNYLMYKSGKHLIYPNYDEEYNFTKLYLYNTANDETQTINLENEISYDSYFAGENNNNIYLVDKKNRVEYEIDLKHKSVKIVSDDNNGIYYNCEKMTNILLNKMIREELTFKNNDIYNFILENNTIYLIIDNKKIQITNKKVKKIIQISNDEIYYLDDKNLYHYHYNQGEELLLSYDEWKFNYNNHIFIFD